MPRENWVFTDEILNEAERLKAEKHQTMVGRRTWKKVARMLGIASHKSLEVTLCMRRKGEWRDKKLKTEPAGETVKKIIHLYLDDGLEEEDVARRLDIPSGVVEKVLRDNGVDSEVREELSREVWVP